MKQLIYKTIYQPQVNYLLRNFNKLLYPLLPKKLTLPPSGTMTLMVENKPLYITTNQTSYLTQLLFWKGYQNFEYTTLFLDLIKETNSFLDIGSNIGYYSLLAARVNPTIKVTAFEPATGPLHFLEKNVKLNHFKNINIEKLALSERNGQIVFYEVTSEKYKFLKHNLAGEGNAGSKTTQRNFVKNNVESIRLDEYVNQKNITSIDLIKMDTEGTEHFILSNASEVISKMKPIIICETLFGMIERELEDIMVKHGYEFYNFNGKGLEKVSTLIRTKNDGITNCFFVHPEKKHLIESYISNGQ